MPTRYSIAQQTDTGGRPSNQDRIAVAEREDAAVLVLADGLGGHAGGELAAQVLVDTITQSFERISEPLIADPATFIVLSVIRGHCAINHVAKGRYPPDDSPRTTAVVCLIQDGHAYWGHVGDSRLYVIRDGRVLTRTQDHSTSEQMRCDGIVSEETLRSLDWYGQLTRCVGGPRRPIVTLGDAMTLAPGDSILLCSDGLWRAFEDEELGRRLDGEPAERALDDLIGEVAQRVAGECDNISGIVMRWESERTTSEPLIGAHQIDQDKLWLELDARAKANPAADDATPSARPHSDRNRSRQLRSAIEEMESFVTELGKRL